METKVVAARNWDDLVFDSRNKEYGAYSLRQAYLRRLFLGLGLSTSMILAMVLMPKLFPGKSVIPELPIPSIVWDPVQPPQIIPNEKIRVTSRGSKMNNNLTRTITLVNDTAASVTENDDVVLSTSTTGEGEGVPSEGNVTGAVVETSNVVAPKKIGTVLEVMPTYEGGMEEMFNFIKRKLRYPAVPRRQEIEGTVFVSFVVNGDGSVTDVEVIRGIHRDCDKEAMRVISMLPGWNGGSQNGSPAAVRMVLPIKFSLKK
jgi:periplasmic protein TonB